TTTLQVEGATLHGAEFTSLQKIDPQNQKWIVYFCPNGALWEELIYDYLLPIKQESTANILAFNYRGTGKSTGSLTGDKDAVQDGIKIVESLLKQGVLPENIVLHGLSFGGGVATHTAAHFAKENKIMHLVNERS